jgi:hypothetical protein
MGATDPSSGTVVMHEVVRGLGALLRSGWKPLRSILVASWDAEEVRPDACSLRPLTVTPQYGLIGSTEWGEDFPEFIDKHVVAYLNIGVLFRVFFLNGIPCAWNVLPLYFEQIQRIQDRASMHLRLHRLPTLSVTLLRRSHIPKKRDAHSGMPALTLVASLESILTRTF